jgi:S1-C subfamily serine protease
VWVSETQILTANHCVADLDAGDALAFATHEDLFPKGSLVATSTLRPELSLVAAHDEAHDIAVLSVPAPPPGHGVAVLRGGEVHQGERAQSMGHPLGLWFSYSSGDVAAVRKKALGGAVLVWLQSTAPISPGSSGGGLFDSDERLIGIAVGILEAGQALNLFVPAIYLRPLLASQGVQ